MKPSQFNNALKVLRLSVYASAPILGISLRQAQRYSNGEDGQEVSAPVEKLLKALLDNVHYLKMRRRDLLKMIEVIDDRGDRVGTSNRDETPAWRGQLKVWLDEIEDLLRHHPSGLPSQID